MFHVPFMFMSHFSAEKCVAVGSGARVSLAILFWVCWLCVFRLLRKRLCVSAVFIVFVVRLVWLEWFVVFSFAVWF